MIKKQKNKKKPGQFMQLDLTDALPNANHSRCLFPKTRLSFRDYEDPLISRLGLKASVTQLYPNFP